MSQIISHSKSLDLLRFPLAVVILIVHVFNTNGITFQGITSGFEKYPLFMGVNHFIDGFLRSQSVPIYYFISGYVFFLGVKMTKETYIRKFRNRVNTLLIPYIIWNFVRLLLLFIITIVPLCNQFRSNVPDFTPSWHGFLSAFWMYDGSLEGGVGCNLPINTPLWFVRNLIIVVVCTPIIHWFLKKTKYVFLILLGVLWFFADWLQIRLYAFDIAFFFFSLGAYMSIYQKDMFAVFGRFFKASIVLYLVFGFSYIFMINTYPDLINFIKKLNIVVGLFLAYNLSTWLLMHDKCKVNKFLASSSFFIYVAHENIIGIIKKLLYIFFKPASSLSLLAVHLLTVLITITVLLSTFYLLKRYTPKLLNILTGRK